MPISQPVSAVGRSALLGYVCGCSFVISLSLSLSLSVPFPFSYFLFLFLSFSLSRSLSPPVSLYAFPVSGCCLLIVFLPPLPVVVIHAACFYQRAAREWSHGRLECQRKMVVGELRCTMRLRVETGRMCNGWWLKASRGRQSFTEPVVFHSMGYKYFSGLRDFRRAYDVSILLGGFSRHCQFTDGRKAWLSNEKESAVCYCITLRYYITISQVSSSCILNYSVRKPIRAAS